MDCEKFESTLLDELYDELDEVTSAAAKRHVAGCARCAALFSGLKATKRLAVLPIVEPPADLEDRILAAAKEAQKVVPIRGRVSRAVSWAGAWAMRPQTAMAALFLLCTGTGVLFMKGHAAKPAASAVTVSEEGTPVASVATPPVARPMEPSSDLAPGEAKVAAAASPAPAPASAPMATTTAASSAYAMNDDDLKGSAVDGLLARGGGAPGRAAAAPAPKAVGGYAGDQGAGSGAAQASLDKSRRADDEGARNASNGAGAPLQQVYGLSANDAPAAQAAPPPSKMASKPSAKKDAPPAFAAGPSGQGGYIAPPPRAPAAPAAESASPFDGAMSAYNAGSYANARDQFHALATSGDLVAALWEARSEREANDCSTAVTLFDAVIRSGPATRAGYDARLDAGRCYRLLGNWDAARQRLNQLLTVPSHMALAKQELDIMSPKAAGHGAARAAPAPNATQQQRQQPAQQKAAPADVQNSY